MEHITQLNGIIRMRTDGRARIAIPSSSFDKLDKDTHVKLIVIKDEVQELDSRKYSEDWKDKEELAIECLSSCKEPYMDLYKLSYQLKITIESTKKLMNRIHFLKGTIRIKRSGNAFQYSLA